MSKYNCEKCQYFTNVKQNFDKHILSKKHNSTKNNFSYYCECKKGFSCSSGLWRHKQACKNQKNETTNNNEQEIPQNEYVKPEDLLSTINEMKSILVEINKNKQSPIINNGIITNNNIVLLNFLNTNYNDVITFEEFIRSITLNYRDIEYMMRDNTEKDIVRWIECLNQVIIDRLKQYKVNERPIHCIQDEEYNYEAFLKNNEWVKEYVKDFDDKTPVLEEKVLIFLAKINQDIDNMMLENETKMNLKKILKNITKKDQLKMMKEELFNGIHINKYELNYNLLGNNETA
jgi:hypothetical protein